MIHSSPSYSIDISKFGHTPDIVDAILVKRHDFIVQNDREPEQLVMRPDQAEEILNNARTLEVSTGVRPFLADMKDWTFLGMRVLILKGYATGQETDKMRHERHEAEYDAAILRDQRPVELLKARRGSGAALGTPGTILAPKPFYGTRRVEARTAFELVAEDQAREVLLKRALEAAVNPPLIVPDPIFDTRPGAINLYGASPAMKAQMEMNEFMNDRGPPSGFKIKEKSEKMQDAEKAWDRLNAPSRKWWEFWK